MSSLTILMYPFLNVGVSGESFYFYCILQKNSCKLIVWHLIRVYTTASDLGLHCLHNMQTLQYLSDAVCSQNGFLPQKVMMNIFSAISIKENKFCAFLFAFLDKEAVQNEFALMGASSLLYQLTPN